jgi:glycosyltransferase involved in cell wall biosynthesis
MSISQEDVRVTSGAVLVTLATAWGPKFGGINAFNTEIVKSLGILPTRHYELICVVPGRATQELYDELLLRFHMQLVSLEATEGEFARGSASEIVRRLDAASEPHRFIWIGHDDKTGPLALELKSLATGSHAVLINHMAHGAYQSVKKGSSLSAAEKRQHQLDMFSNADLCLAIGPMLRSHLEDMLACVPKRPPVEMLVPGLADPTEYGVEIRDSAPENYVAFMAGRLDKEDDRIKQGRLALRGFGKAVRKAGKHSAIRRSPTLRMRGIRPSEEKPLRDLLKKETRRAVNFDFQDYTDDRTAYFRDLASASVAMMPSWHEGFGLTAWEAIASALPVVISEESGVYRLLDEDCSGAGLSQSVAHIQVDGWLASSDAEPNHTEKDVARVADALLGLALRSIETKQQAMTLRRNLLTLGLDWKGAVLALIDAIERNLGLSLTAERPAAIATPLQPPVLVDTTVPDWLHVPPPRPWRREPKLPTSILLAARDEIVRFDPERQPFLQQMLEWASRPNDLSARLLFGPGGMGKTRLALELARRLQRDGWLSVWLASKLPEDWVESWEHVLRTRGQERLLLVIDYADSRPAEVLAALNQALERLRAGGNPAPLRLLLLARSESWLGSLPQHPNCPQELAAWLSVPTVIESLALPPWRRDDTARLVSYRLALGDYAAATGLATPPNAYVPRLSDRVFDRPLYLHLAALAALEGQRPASADALLRDQLRREWRYWRGTHGEGIAGYDDWADALAYVILCQGAGTDQLRHALETLGVDAPALAAALHRSYAAGDDRVAALEPDLIAEALLRERLAGHRGSALLDAALGAGIEQLVLALPVVARLAAQTRAFEPDQTAAWERVLIVAVASHWPRHPDEWLAAAHRAEHGLGELLFAAWQQLDESARTSLAADLTLPLYSTNLLRISVAIRRHQLRLAPDPASSAGALNSLARALSNLGDAVSRTEALACARESVQIRRQLAETQPAAYLPDLAASLNTVASRLSEQGNAASDTEALACARESVQIRRQLAETQPAAYLPDLASSLDNLAGRLSEQGDALSRTEALACARESVQIRRQLAETWPAAYLPDVASSLDNLAIRWSEQGDAASRSEALDCALQAVQIRRQLADAQPAAYLRDLAWSLNNLSNRWSEQGGAASRTEALACARESVQIYRQLAEPQPAAYLPHLAMSLRSLNYSLSGQGDAASRSEALACAREALQICHQLAEPQPSAYLPDLADSLNNVANSLSEQADAPSPTEALDCAREAAQIRRQLAATRPAAYLPDLAESLNNLANRLSEQGDAASRTEALACAREAVKIYRQLAETQPAAYLPYLAGSLNNLANSLSEQGDAASRTEALACARESVQIYRQLAETQPAAYLPDVAMSLDTLANRLSEQGDAASRTEAVACARESVQIYGRLHASMPAAFERNLNLAVKTLARVAGDNGRNAEEEIKAKLDAQAPEGNDS